MTTMCTVVGTTCTLIDICKSSDRKMKLHIKLLIADHVTYSQSITYLENGHVFELYIIII